jgi:hypothetical protein
VSKKIKVSKEEFAEALLHWVAMQISNKGIKQDARVFDLTSEAPLDSRETKELFGLNLSNSEQLMTLLDELLALNLWMVVLACDVKLKDVDQRTDCLNIFIRQFFDRIIKDTGEDFEQWIESIELKRNQYNKAAKKNPLALPYLIQNNLHGQGPPNAIVQFQINLYLEKTLKTLMEVLDRLEIERND